MKIPPRKGISVCRNKADIIGEQPSVIRASRVSFSFSVRKFKGRAKGVVVFLPVCGYRPQCTNVSHRIGRVIS